MIPQLRKAGIFVERTRRPLSRGMRYRLWKAPDETVAICYSRAELAQFAAGLTTDATPLVPAGANSAIVRPRCRYL